TATRHSGQPADEIVAAVRLAPGKESGVIPHPAGEYRRIIFRPDDGFRIGSFVFEAQDGVARLFGQHGADARGHAFGETVVGRTAPDVYHVHFPHASVRVAEGGVPLDARFFRIDEVVVFHADDARMRGDARRRPEAVGDRNRIGIDVQVDVPVFHHQSRGEAADDVYLCSYRLPACDQLRFGDDFGCPPQV